jgi:hypothetical protein
MNDKTSTAAVATAVVPAVNTLTSAQEKTIAGFTTKAQSMRFLANLGWKTGPIAKYLSGLVGKNALYTKPVKYQHVRNQLNQKIKTAAQA